MSFIAIMGKTGSGKTTLVNALTKFYPDLYMRAESYTTRVPRDNESAEIECSGIILLRDPIFDHRFFLFYSILIRRI